MNPNYRAIFLELKKLSISYDFQDDDILILPENDRRLDLVKKTLIYAAEEARVGFTRLGDSSADVYAFLCIAEVVARHHGLDAKPLKKAINDGFTTIVAHAWSSSFMKTFDKKVLLEAIERQWQMIDPEGYAQRNQALCMHRGPHPLILGAVETSPDRPQEKIISAEVLRRRREAKRLG